MGVFTVEKSTELFYLPFLDLYLICELPGDTDRGNLI